MKTLNRTPIILIVFLVVFSSCVPIEFVPNDERQMEKIYNISKLDKEEIYSKTIFWIGKEFVSANDVISFTDKENGLIVVNGVINCYPKVNLGVEAPTKYRMQIDIKDNKIRITFSNYVMFLAGKNRYIPSQKVYIDEIHERLTVVADNLYNSLTSESPDQNW